MGPMAYLELDVCWSKYRTKCFLMHVYDLSGCYARINICISTFII